MIYSFRSYCCLSQADYQSVCPAPGCTPATQKTYGRMMADFLAFLVVTGLTPCQVNVDIILAFLHYLVDNYLSVANISNYLAGLRTMFIIHDLPTHPFRDEKIQMFVRSVIINRPLVKSRSILTKQIL